MTSSAASTINPRASLQAEPESVINGVGTDLHSAVVLMARSDIIDLKRATEMARRAPKTIRQWCRIHGIGRQTGPGARIEVSAPALEMLIHGDFEALDKLRMGERNDPMVKRYFDWLGLPSERRPAR